jgi:hypothetical protein
MKPTTSKDRNNACLKRIAAYIRKNHNKAYEQVVLKGMSPDPDNVMIELISMHFKRKSPIK